MTQLAELSEPVFSMNDRRNQSLINLALGPYKTHCRYLLRASARRSSNTASIVEAEGEFSIPESCYIADTGHFNAVEFNICYNQLAYYLLAKVIENDWVPALSSWKMNDFSQRQLPDCLIVEFRSSFRKPLNARLFKGRLELNRVSAKKGKVFMKTACVFEDACGARSEGEATLAILSNYKARHPYHSVLCALKSSSSKERENVMCTFLRARIAESLGIEVHEVGTRSNLMDLGIDSLKAIELKTLANAELGLSLSTTLLFDYPTVEALSGHLLQQLGMAPVEIHKPQPCSLLHPEIINLPQEQVANLLAAELQTLNE
jgi:acyl carrier protein